MSWSGAFNRRVISLIGMVAILYVYYRVLNLILADLKFSSFCFATNFCSSSKGSGRIREEMLAMEGSGASFDFKKHVLLSEEAISSVQVHSLTEMGYNVKPGQLDFAYTDPFPFLSEKGLKLYREALTSPEVAQNCYYNSAMVPLTVRNATGHSKFLHQISTDNHMLCSR